MGAPQARIQALAQGLQRRGVSVTVHTVYPHYPQGAIQPPYRNRPVMVESHEGVHVVRAAVYPAANIGFARRLLNHASSAASMLATARWSGAADVVVAETPPLFTAGAAIAYSRLKGARLVVNVADRWPASAVELGMLRSRHAIAAATRLEGQIYRSAAAISVPTRGLKEGLSSHPHAAGKVVRMSPSVDVSCFDPAPPAPNARLRVLYAGTVGLAQGLGTLIEAAELLEGRVEVRVAGGGAEAQELGRRVTSTGQSDITMLGVVPHASVPGLYQAADVAVVLLRDRPIFEGALPTKLLEAMAAGRPVLLSGRGESADLVEAAGAGVVVPPEDPHALAAALDALHRDPEARSRMGAAARRHAAAHFDRQAALDRWAELLQGVVDDDPAAAPASC